MLNTPAKHPVPSAKDLPNLALLEKGIGKLLVDSDKSASSPAFRSELLAWLKTTYKETRDLCEALLFADGDGTKCAKRLSAFQDDLITALYNFAVVEVYEGENRSSGERVSVAAVGGYGRGTLAPGSDIDLLFILPFKQTAWCEQIVEYVLYFLWDMGFKVGHATRNLDECIRQAKDDMTIRTSVLEARFITGDKALFTEMVERFNSEVVAKTAKEFVDAKLAERDSRHQKTGESRYLVEPNVKDGKGGLRDLHTLFWIGKYYYRVERQRDLVKAGLFSADEFKRFKKAEKFLWTVRCHMHFLTGRPEERLSFDIQREIATRLKYITRGSLLDVERFMKHYFLMAKEVGDLTLIVCAELEEKQAKSITGINGLIRSIRFPRRRIKGTKDFIDDHGRINVTDETVFETDPINLLRLYKLADDNGLDIHPDANYLVTNSLKLVDKDLRKNDEANRLFLSILTTRNGPERLLRKMNESGLLGKFIPSFGKIVAMMQFNMYHHYTVDEHLIRAVGILSDIENGKIDQDHPLAGALLPQIDDREALYVAVLIHDIAKGRKEDHSIAGARVAKSLCPRLGFSKERSALVAWLVEEHLTMSLTAQSRDLSDRKTIETFSQAMQSVERMRYLLILTVCDIRAVGPGVWNGWKGQLLRTLYFETEPLLTGGFSQANHSSRIDAARTALGENLTDWQETEKDKYLDLLYGPYLLSTPLETQIRHLNFLRDADKQGQQLATDVFTREFEAITEITIWAPDHPKLLSILAAACSASGANIVDAKIHTLKDGKALDAIHISRTHEEAIDEIRRAENIIKLIEQALRGEVRLQSLLERNSSAKRRSKAFSIPPEVAINNDISDDFTVIQIECLDRPGILAVIAFTIAELNLDIVSAQIATFGEKAIDSFYVTDLLGDKITLESRQNKIIHSLTEALMSAGGKSSRRATGADTLALPS